MDDEQIEAVPHIVNLRNTRVDSGLIKYFGQSHIPRLLFQTWSSSTFLCEDIAEILRLRDSLPETQFVFHDDDDMFEYMTSNWARHPIYEVFLSVQYGAAKADIWRYCILYEYGGIYLDIDSIFDTGLLEEIQPDTSFLVSTERNVVSDKHTHLNSTYHQINKIFPEAVIDRHLNLQWLFFCSAKNDILALAIDLICSRWHIYKDNYLDSALDGIINFTGPALFSEAIKISTLFGRQVKVIPLDFGGRAIFKSSVVSKSFYTSRSNKHYHGKHSVQISRSLKALNVGCGGEVRLGFENIDANPIHPTIVLCDIEQMNFSESSFDLIIMKDVLEHLSFPAALRVIRMCLKSISKNGQICIQTTSVEAVSHYLGNDSMDLTTLNYLLFAGVSWRNGVGSWASADVVEYDWHKSLFSFSVLKRILYENGFEITYYRIEGVTTNALQRRDTPPSFNMKIWAQRI